MIHSVISGLKIYGANMMPPIKYETAVSLIALNDLKGNW